MTLQRIPITLLLIVFLSSCAPVGADYPTQTASPIISTVTPTLLASATPVPTFTATPTPTPTLAPMTDFMKGLVYFPAGWGGDNRPENDWILQNIALPTGANWIRLHNWCFQDSIRETDVYCKPDEVLSDEGYIHLVEVAHSLGMRVMGEFGINCCHDPEGYWTGDIGKAYNEEQWSAWFESYSIAMLHYAELAEKTGTDYFVLAAELESTTHREKEWRELIARVRQVYHGKISMTFSNEDSLQEVQFWDALDAIGVHPYYLDLPGVTDPTVQQLRTAFLPYANRLEVLSEKWNKPILIDEIGFWSIHTMTQNYNNKDLPNPIDLQEQNDLYQALFDTFYEKEWVSGIFCYAISGSNTPAEPWNTHLDFIGKPAENVIRSFFGAPPFPTSTPIAPPASDLNATETIYDDGLNPSWSVYQPEGEPAYILFDQSDIAVNGNAIKATLPHWYSVDFSNDNVDWSKYQWLEFDMYIEPRDVPKGFSIGVTLRDTAYQSSIFAVELVQSQFIADGTIQPGTWQHVQIPLAAFGPLLSNYRTIIISRYGIGENKPITLYVDNVLLSGE